MLDNRGIWGKADSVGKELININWLVFNFMKKIFLAAHIFGNISLHFIREELLDTEQFLNMWPYIHIVLN